MLAFIPQPKQIAMGTGTFALPLGGTIGVSDQSLFAVAQQARTLLDGGAVGVNAVGVPDALALSLNPTRRAGSYTLTIAPDGIRIEGQDVAAVFHGVQTLAQVLKQSPADSLPALTIEDWPDFPYRAVYYDLARGRVPKLERLKELVDLLAQYKINELQLYIEHTFRFRRHPDIGKDASPLTAEDIMELDAYCLERQIELVPSLSSFGHLATVLHLPQYRHLAEDWGEGKYVDPAANNTWFQKAWSLAASNEESYIFLRQLFDEFLPCFSSKRFNVCCDENYDLGWGQSYELAQKLGRGRLYLNHINRLREMAAAHGKSIMFWGDIIRHYPDLIPDIPRDVTPLDWGYHWRENFDRVKDFTNTGLPTYVCPTTCGYVTLFPRMHEAMANIAGWAKAGRQYGTIGMLNTDWGDGGHYNFLECAWPGYLFGAEQSWNADADIPSFLARFSKLFLGIDNPEFTAALVALGDVAQTNVNGYYQSLWRHVYFAAPGDDVLLPKERDANISTQGKISEQQLMVDAALGRDTFAELERIKAIFAQYAKTPGADPHQVLDYWFFALDTLLHATRKLAVLGGGGNDTPDNRRLLLVELHGLRERFEALWLARNRPSEIGITLGYYQHAIAGLEATQ